MTTAPSLPDPERQAPAEHRDHRLVSDRDSRGQHEGGSPPLHSLERVPSAARTSPSLPPGTPDLSTAATRAPAKRLWLDLQEALLEDFLDNLPRPTHPADLAKRLYLSHSVVRYSISRSHIVATRVSGRWEIDTHASREWIARRYAALPARRRSARALQSSPPPAPLYVRISAADAIAHLDSLMSTGLSPEAAVASALRTAVLCASPDIARDRASRSPRRSHP